MSISNHHPTIGTRHRPAGEGARVQPAHEVLAWQRAHQLVLDMYRATDRFPREEQFGLVASMRRAALVIAVKIVEGDRCVSLSEFTILGSTIQASLEELKYYLELSRELGYLLQEHMEFLYDSAEAIGEKLRELKWHPTKELAHVESTSIVVDVA